MAYGIRAGYGKLPSGGDSGAGVTATLTAGQAGATTVPLEISVSSGTLIDWDLDKSEDGGATWSTVETGITGTTKTVSNLNPDTSIKFRGTARVEVEAVGVVSATTAEQIYLPVLQNYAMVMPGSLNLGTATNANARSWCINVCPRRSMTSLSFSRVRVGLLNRWTSSTYTVKHLSVGRMSDSALTENPATGFVTLGTNQVVPAGSGSLGSEALAPGIWRSAWHTITPNGGNGVRIAIELGENHPYHTWGGTPYNYGIGWLTGNTGLSNSLSSNWSVSNLTGTFGDHPLLFVEFDGLSQSVVWLPFIGDSHFNGIGDEGQPFRPYAVAGRLMERWTPLGVRILPVNLARSGANTAQISARLQWVVDNFPVRAAVVQGFSINNISQSIPYSQFRTDWIAAENTESAAQISILPMLGAGADGIPAQSGWWAPMKAEQDWLIDRRPETVASIRASVQDMSDGGYNSGYVYSDAAHPNEAGYDKWEVDSHTSIRAWCEEKAGMSL